MGCAYSSSLTMEAGCNAFGRLAVVPARTGFNYFGGTALFTRCVGCSMAFAYALENAPLLLTCTPYRCYGSKAVNSPSTRGNVPASYVVGLPVGFRLRLVFTSPTYARAFAVATRRCAVICQRLGLSSSHLQGAFPFRHTKGRQPFLFSKKKTKKV